MHFQTLLILFIFIALSNAARNRTRYPRRQTFQHPAFSMFSMYPGLGMGANSYGQTECIRGEIVCPAYCIMEDEWGCKSCPCGPANGMAPSVKDDRRPTQSNNEDHECLGTILCMLTCKDGYKLGPRGNNGCQSCECNKKNESKSDQQNQNKEDCIGPACSAKNGVHAGSSTTSESTNTTVTNGRQDCTWPLCVNGEITNNGAAPHSGLSPLPKGGNISGKGNIVPGINCLGPECSAKNGMSLMNRVQQSVMTPSTRPSSCPTKQDCADNCKGESRLGSPGNNGCPVCECIIVKVPTTPSTRVLLMPESSQKSCPQVDNCILTCKYGYKLDQQSDRNKCPFCQCIVPLTPPPPAITERPNVVGLLKVCPDAVHCMKTCTTGYTLTSSHYDECPVCICNKEPEVLLLCEKPLSCPNGCTVGYKCDINGCPTCDCVAPTETLLKVEVHTTIMKSALQCNPRFSCVERCSFGYKTGGNGCPACRCLQPVTVQTETLQLIPTPPPVHQTVLVMPKTDAPPTIPKPSGIGCLGPECSAIHTLTGPGNVFMSAVNGLLSQSNGDRGTSEKNGVQNGSGSIPKPRPQKTHVIVPMGEIGKSANYIGLDVANSHSETVVTQPEIIVLPEVDKADQGQSVTAGPQTAMEACPETVECIAQCNGDFELVPIDGTTCPACSCKDIEPACESCSQLTAKEEIMSTPSPGQCVAILHCVMTCTKGYDIGDINQSDGCPTCTCLED